MSAIARLTLSALWGTGGESACAAEAELESGARGHGAATVGEALVAPAAAGEEITAALAGIDAADQWAVDWALASCDGTPRRHRLGQGALLAASLAVARAAAAEARVSLWRHLGGVAARTVPVPQVALAEVVTDTGDIALLSLLPLGAPNVAAALAAGQGARARIGAARFSSLRAACAAAAEAIDADSRLVLTASAAALSGGLPEAAPIAAVAVTGEVSGRAGWQALRNTLGASLPLAAEACCPAESGLFLAGMAEGVATAVRLDPLRAASVSEVLALADEAHALGLAVLLGEEWAVGIDSATASLALASGAGRVILGTGGGPTANALVLAEKKLANSARYAATNCLRR